MTYLDVFFGLVIIFFVFITLGILVIVISNILEYMSLSEEDKNIVKQIRRMNSEQLQDFMVTQKAYDGNNDTGLSDYVYKYAMDRAVHLKKINEEN